jgi:GTPase SAR1 family protein
MSLGNARTSLKVLFIGDPKVGISSFLTVLRGKPFPKLYIPTHADIVDLRVMVPHRSPTEDSKSWEGWPDHPELNTDSDSSTTKSTIQLLDITTYGEIYRWSKEAAYRGANAVVLCFSVARRESFESLKSKVSRLPPFFWSSVSLAFLHRLSLSSGCRTLCDRSQVFLSFSQE